jgi:hypothetical protein
MPAGMLLRAALVAALFGTSASFSPRMGSPLRPAAASAAGAGIFTPAARRFSAPPPRPRWARSMLRATVSAEAEGIRSDDAVPRDASAADITDNGTPRPVQGQAATAALNALRMLRAEKLAAGETVFFDFPAILGGNETAPEAAQKPLLLYLTGMDGVGVSGEPQV